MPVRLRRCHLPSPSVSVVADLLLPLRPITARAMLEENDSLTARLVRIRFLAGTHNERAIQEASRLLKQVKVKRDHKAHFVSLGGV